MGLQRRLLEMGARLVCGEEGMVLPARGQGLPAARRRLFVEDTQIRKFRFVGGALRWPVCRLPAHLTSSVQIGVAGSCALAIVPSSGALDLKWKDRYCRLGVVQWPTC